MPSKPNRCELIGKVFHTNNYGDLKIIEYRDSHHVLIEFVNTRYRKICYMRDILLGKIKDAMSPKEKQKSVEGIAHIGHGVYTRRNNFDAYSCWIGMIKRCYNKKMLIRKPAYKDCVVCKKWFDFQNFAEWYYKQIKEDGWQIDKDILIKGNKTYCPEACVFVPKQINLLFVTQSTKRGKYPIGVTFSSHGNYSCFRARYGCFGKPVDLGVFQSSEEAFLEYKKYKERFILNMANIYNGRIDGRLYEAMVNYKVEITD